MEPQVEDPILVKLNAKKDEEDPILAKLNAKESSIPEVSLTATGDIKPVGSPDPIPYSVTATDKKELSFGKKITTPTLEALVGVTKKNFEENPIFKDRKNRDIYFNALSKKYDPGTIESLRSFTEREYEHPILNTIFSPEEMFVEGVPAGIKKTGEGLLGSANAWDKITSGEGDLSETIKDAAKSGIKTAAGVAETGMAAIAPLPAVQPVMMGFHAIQGTPIEAAIMPVSTGIQKYYESKGINPPEWASDLGVLSDLAWGGILGLGAKKLIGKGSVKPQDITDALNETFKDPKDLNAIVESGGDPVVADIIKKKSDLTEALANPEISDQVKGDFIMPAIEAANQNIVVELGTKTGTNTAEAATVATLEHLKDQQSKMPEGARGALQPAIDELQVKVESFNPESKSPDIPGTPITEETPVQPIIEPDTKPKVEASKAGSVDIVDVDAQKKALEDKKQEELKGLYPDYTRMMDEINSTGELREFNPLELSGNIENIKSYINDKIKSSLNGERARKIKEEYDAKIKAVEQSLKEQPKPDTKPKVEGELKVQSSKVKDILEMSPNDSDALSLIYNADLTPTEKQMLWRQYKSGVMNLNDVKNYSGVIDLEKLNAEDIGKWARAALEKQKSKDGKFNAEDIDFEELPAIIEPDTKPKVEGSVDVGGDVDKFVNNFEIKGNIEYPTIDKAKKLVAKLSTAKERLKGLNENPEETLGLSKSQSNFNYALNKTKEATELEIKETQYKIDKFKREITKESEQNGLSKDEVLKAAEQALKEQPKPTGSTKEGFTEGKDLNKIFVDLKGKYGDKKGSELYDVANRLVNPNKNTIIEVRGNGVVVKEGDKYIFKPFGNTDANIKKWTLYEGLDITDQFKTATPPGEEGGINKLVNEKETESQGRKKGLLDTPEPDQQGAVTPLPESKADIPLSEPKSDPAPPKTSLELAKEKLKAAKERAAKLRDNTNLGTTIDPFEKTKQQAIADREVLDGYIGVAKEYIKEGIKTIEEFAKAIGEKVEDVKKAWDFAEKGEIYGIKVDMLDDAVKDALHDKGDRRKFDEVETEARRKVAVGEIRPEEMINKINSGEKYLPNGEDIIALIDHKVNLEKQRTEIKQRFDEAQDQGVKNKIQGELDIVTDKLFQWDEMAIRTAADQSQAFRFRQLMRDNEFNAVKAIRDWKAEDKNGTIPAEMEAKIKEWAEKFRKLNEEFAKKDQELILEKEGRAEDNMKAEAEREKLKEALEAKKNPEKSKSTLSPEKLARKKELWKDIYGQANDVFHVIAKMATKDGIEFLSLVFEEAAGDFKKFSKEIIKGAGKEIAPYLKKLYKDAGGTDEGIYGASKPFLNKKGDLEVPHSLIRALVESGVEKIEDITKAVYAMVKDEFPGITETKVRDTITKYGLTRNPNPDVIERKISLAKRIGRKLSSVERLKAGKNALLSGLLPEKITPIERQLNREIRNMQKLLPKTQEEITKVWKTAVERTKTRLEHQIEDLKIAIDTATKMVKADGKATPDTKEINDLRDRKSALQKVYDEKFGKNAHELTDAERVERAINALEKESKNIEKDIKNGEIEYKKTKSLPVNEALKKARERNKALKDELAALRKEEGLADARENEIRIDANIKYMLKQRKRIENKDFDPIPPPEFKKTKELLDTLVQRRKVKQEWETAREKHRMEQRTLAEQWYETWRDIWGGTKSAITSLDVSAAGRQGLPLSIANPAMAKKAMKIQFEHMFSQEASDRWLADLQNKPIYQLMKDSKLYISEPTSKLLAKEEAFASNFAEKIPWVKPSERAYVGYLNSLRTDMFEKMVGVLKDQGKTWENNPQAYKDAARFITERTGRGSFGKNDAAWSKVLSDPVLGMFSPKYVASRFEFFNPKNYLDPKIDASVRQERIKSTVKFMGAVAAVLALAKYSGMADVSLDPTDTDFLKIKIGNKRIDILAGYSQAFVFMAKMIKEAYKQIKYEQTGVKPEGGTNDSGLLNTAAHFYRGKMAPAGSSAIDLYMGEDIVGNKSTIAGEAAGLVTPLVARDIYDLYKKEGAGWAAGLSIPLVFGIPTTSYGVKDDIYNVVAENPNSGVKLNALGENVNTKWYKPDEGGVNDVWKFLIKYEQSPNVPKKSDIKFKNGAQPTDIDFFKYVKATKDYAYEELRDLRNDGVPDKENKGEYIPVGKLSPEKQRTAITGALERAKNKALTEVFGDKVNK